MTPVTLPSLILLALSLTTSGAAPVGPGPSPREDRAPATKTFDQRQQGTTNIQAHLDNIVVILVPSNRISITDFAAKTEPEHQHKPSPAVNKLLQQLSELKSAPSSIEAQPAEFFNSIPESKAKPEDKDAVHVTQIGSIPVLHSSATKKEPAKTKPKEESPGSPSSLDPKPAPVQMDGAAKKFPFQIDTNPLEIPVLVIQDP